MKNTLRFGILALAALIVFSITACGGADTNGGGPEVPGVIEVKVLPASYTVYRGFEHTFFVTVSETADKAVTWSIEGDGLHADTAIDQSGKLSVSPDEEQTELIVKATLVADETIYGTATVTVPAPTVTGVEISLAGGILINPWNVRNKAVDIDSGKTQQFLAKVVGENFPNQDVEWSIDGTVTDGTSLSGGLLTVSANEPQNSTFTVRAVSKVVQTTFDTITVTVKPPTISFLKVDVVRKADEDPNSPPIISATVPVDFTVTVLGTGNVQGLYEIGWAVERTDGRPLAIDEQKEDDDGSFLTIRGTHFEGNTLHLGAEEAFGEWTGDTEEEGAYTPYPPFWLDVTATVTSDTLSFSPSMETSVTLQITPEYSFVPTGQPQR